MFSTTHDAILLIVAALYVLVTLARTVLLAAHYQKFGSLPALSVASLTVPALIATTLAIVAVIW